MNINISYIIRDPLFKDTEVQLYNAILRCQEAIKRLYRKKKNTLKS